MLRVKTRLSTSKLLTVKWCFENSKTKRSKEGLPGYRPSLFRAQSKRKSINIWTTTIKLQ